LSTLSDISLRTSLSFGLAALFIAIAIAISIWVYRNPTPPVSKGWRAGLTILRTTSITIILMLLFEPILSLEYQNNEKPVIAVLIDSSASMGLVDQKTDRAQELKNVLAAPIFSNPEPENVMEFYTFSDQLHEMFSARPDSLQLTGDGTNIRRALEDLDNKMTERHFTAVVLLSDGGGNLGENPARFAQKYQAPIFTVPIGDPSEQKDIILTNVSTNEITYSGKKTPVEVFVRNNGFAGQRVNIKLTHKGETVDTKTIALAKSGVEQKVRLNFTPTGEGAQKYQIKAGNLEGELTANNNKKTFYSKVLKSKLQVILVAGGPSSDFSFLSRTLKADKNIEVTEYIEKGNGQFYNTAAPTLAKLDKADCFVFVDFPRSKSNLTILSLLKKKQAAGTPLLLLAGKNTQYDKLQPIGEFLPFELPVRKTSEKNIFSTITPQGVHHPVFRVYEDDFENKDSWSRLPPVFSNHTSPRLKSGAITLAQTTEKNVQGQRAVNTAIVAHSSGKRKSFAVLVYGLWRWDLLSRGFSENSLNYQLFWRNVVRWLTTHDDSKLVNVKSNKTIYRSGEEVRFSGQVYFEDYQPVDGAEVVVQIKNSAGTQELTLNNIGDGRYEGGFQALEGDDYNFTATAHLQGRVLGRDNGRFSVEPFSLEFQNTRMNETLLRRISSVTGGETFRPQDISQLNEKLKFRSKTVISNSEWEIWKQTPMLMALIFLLALEWFVRKWKGML